MGYRVKGTLKLPDGTPATNAEIEFISRKNFSPLVQELKSNIKCSATGAYDVTLEYGEYAVIVYPGGTYPAALGTIILAADTVAGQDLPTLLQQAGWQPATPEYIQQIAAWLAEAGELASKAEASATSAANSASTAGAAVSSHANATGLHLPATGTTNNGKVLKAGATAGSAVWSALSAVDVGGLGTAATRDVTTSAADSTPSRLLRVGDFGLGHQLDLRDSKYTTGLPQDLYETGYTVGFSAGGLLGIAGLSNISYGTLECSFHWNDQSGVRAMFRRFTAEGVTYVQQVFSGATWGVWRKLYDETNTVGSVSSGAIIERGSNANGRFTKYADGTLMMDNGGAAITTNPATAVGPVTSVDSSKLRFGYWK